MQLYPLRLSASLLIWFWKTHLQNKSAVNGVQFHVQFRLRGLESKLLNGLFLAYSGIMLLDCFSPSESVLSIYLSIGNLPVLYIVITVV